MFDTGRIRHLLSTQLPPGEGMGPLHLQISRGIPVLWCGLTPQAATHPQTYWSCRLAPFVHQPHRNSRGQLGIHLHNQTIYSPGRGTLEPGETGERIINHLGAHLGRLLKVIEGAGGAHKDRVLLNLNGLLPKRAGRLEEPGAILCRPHAVIIRHGKPDPTRGEEAGEWHRIRAWEERRDDEGGNRGETGQEQGSEQTAPLQTPFQPLCPVEEMLSMVAEAGELAHRDPEAALGKLKAVLKRDRRFAPALELLTGLAPKLESTERVPNWLGLCHQSQHTRAGNREEAARFHRVVGEGLVRQAEQGEERDQVLAVEGRAHLEKALLLWGGEASREKDQAARLLVRALRLLGDEMGARALTNLDTKKDQAPHPAPKPVEKPLPAQGAPEPEKEAVTADRAEPELVPEPEPEEPGVEVKAKTETGVEDETPLEAETRAQVKTAPKVEPKVEAEPEPQVQATAKPTPQAEPEPEPEPAPEPTIRIDLEPITAPVQPLSKLDLPDSWKPVVKKSPGPAARAKVEEAWLSLQKQPSPEREAKADTAQDQEPAPVAADTAPLATTVGTEVATTQDHPDLDHLIDMELEIHTKAQVNQPLEELLLPEEELEEDIDDELDLIHIDLTDLDQALPSLYPAEAADHLDTVPLEGMDQTGLEEDHFPEMDHLHTPTEEPPVQERAPQAQAGETPTPTPPQHREPGEPGKPDTTEGEDPQQELTTTTSASAPAPAEEEKLPAVEWLSLLVERAEGTITPQSEEKLQSFLARVDNWHDLIQELDQALPKFWKTEEHLIQGAIAIARLEREYLGDFLAAENRLSLILEATGDQVTLLEELVSLYGQRENWTDLVTATVRLAETLLETGQSAPDPAQAEAATGPESEPPQARAYRLFYQAAHTLHEKMGHDLEALQYLDRYLSRQDGDLAAWELSASIYQSLGNPDQSAHSLQKAADLCDTPAARVEKLEKMALILDSRGRTSQAAPAWEEVLRLMPDNEQALHALGEHYQRTRQKEKELTVVEQHLTLLMKAGITGRPLMGEKLSRLLLRRALLIKSLTGDLAAATRDLERSVKIWSQNVEAIEELSNAYRSTGNDLGLARALIMLAKLMVPGPERNALVREIKALTARTKQ